MAASGIVRSRVPVFTALTPEDVRRALCRPTPKSDRLIAELRRMRHLTDEVLLLHLR